MSSVSRRRRSVVMFAGLVVALFAPGARGAAGVGSSTPPGSGDWPGYGHDAQRTFAAPTSLDASNVTGLAPAWFFPTGDAVTATPTVVNGVVYVGSWDTKFYALDDRTGELRWSFALDAQPAITPQPGQSPRDIGSDGGMVTSSAWYEAGNGQRPDLVIVGGGYTLYALDAHTGSLYWKHAYPGRPDLPPDPDHDSTRIFSSPVVADGRVLVGVSSDGQPNHRGYILAADLDTGAPDWVRETDVDAGGAVQNDGCGNVWSSGAVLPAADLVVFDLGDCGDTNASPTAESVMALSIADGSVAWTFRPSRNDPGCDADFGATANVGVDAAGSATFLGAGGKDGTYYSLDPSTGALRWSTNVVFGGPAGGFIGTTAFDGQRVYGATALGDFGNATLCDPTNPADVAIQDPSAHIFDARTGGILAQASRAQSFSPTTVAGGMTFNTLALKPQLQVRSAVTSNLLLSVTLPAPSWSGVAVLNDHVVFGVGTSIRAQPAGVTAYRVELPTSPTSTSTTATTNPEVVAQANTPIPVNVAPTFTG